MDQKQFKTIGRLLKRVYAELEAEALKSGIVGSSKKFQEMQDKARELVLSNNGFTLEQYLQAKADSEAFTQSDLLNFVEETKGEVKRLSEVHIPSKKEIMELAHEVAKQYIVPPKVTNEIVKEIIIKEPKILETVREITNTVEYNDEKLREELSKIDKKVSEIKIPEPFNEKELEERLSNKFGEMFEENINTLGMPNFRKLAMGLQGQIDDVKAQIVASGTVATVVAGTGISVNSTDPANPIVTNSSPDQTVAITAGTNITSVTGTYPNFTINAATQTTDISGKASVALDNLSSVAINTSLVSDTDNTDDLGTTLKKWANLFVTTIGATATRVTKGWFTDLEVTNAIAGSITGNAATVTTNANLTGDVTSVGNAATVVKINGTSMAGLATGILKNTTTTGVPSIAIAADFPTLNQNTTGSAATVTGLTLNGEALTLNTGALTLTPNVDDSSVLTIGAGAVSVSGTNTGDNAANTSIAATKLDDFATPDDNTDLNANTTNHGLLLKATAPAAGLYNYVGITNGETAYTNKALFDATVPSTQAFGDAAAAGSAAVAARRDHTHAMMAAPTTITGNAGSATVLQTTRAIYGNNFDGSAALTQVIGSAYGGTGNGFSKFTGATTAEKTYTLPDADATILYSGGALGTPASGTVTNLTGTASININGTVGATTPAAVKATTIETSSTIDLGHADDTTIARASAGVVSIQGSNIMTVASADTVTGVKTLGTTGAIKLGSAVGDKCEIRLNNSALNDETWSGTVLDATAGATLAVGDACYLKTADGEWYLTDGILDGTDTGCKLKLGICVLAAGDGEATKILLDGLIASAAFPAFTVGAPVYLSDTSGDLVVAQPSTTNFVIRVVGFAVSSTILHFSPSNDWIVKV